VKQRPAALDLFWIGVACSIAVGAALRWDALRGSLLHDDWDHYAMYAGIYPAPRSPFDMFNFVADSDTERAALRRTGRLPWWSSDDLQLSVFRPLSSLLLHFDYAVLRAHEHTARAHVHSMLWWVALLLGSAALLRRLCSVWVASLAVLLLALDDALTLPVLWIAHRSELVATALIVWGCQAYLQDRGPGLRALAFALFALGLFAGEYALAALAYVVAYELTRATRSIGQRLAGLLPIALLALAYLAPRQLLGYGVRGSGFYIDPFDEPLRFLEACSWRLPYLIADLMFGYAAEWYAWEPPWLFQLREQHLLPEAWLTVARAHALQAALAALASAIAIAALAWLGRRRATLQQLRLRWLLLGSILSLLPLCSTAPMSRLTLAAAIGASACLAALLVALIRVLCRSQRRWPSRALAGAAALAIVGVHGLYAAKRTRAETTHHAFTSHLAEAFVLGAELDRDRLASQHVLIISSRDWNTQLALPYVWHLHHEIMPLSSEVLSPFPEGPAELVRLGSSVLELHLPIAADDRSLTARAGYRRSEALFRAGDRIRGENYDVEIAAAYAGEPTRVRVILPVPLEDPRYVFLFASDKGLRRIALPSVGATLKLPPPAWPNTGN
jgi:hypothetical protein